MTDKKPWYMNEDSLTECAKQAWGAEDLYEIHGWTMVAENAIMAYGYPPRAEYEYEHVFLFAEVEAGIWHLINIGRAPYRRYLTWKGTFVTNKRNQFRHYKDGQWTAVTD